MYRNPYIKPADPPLRSVISRSKGTPELGLTSGNRRQKLYSETVSPILASKVGTVANSHKNSFPGWHQCARQPNHTRQTEIPLLPLASNTSIPLIRSIPSALGACQPSLDIPHLGQGCCGHRALSKLLMSKSPLWRGTYNLVVRLAKSLLSRWKIKIKEMAGL